jgi:hypothetical protein
MTLEQEIVELAKHRAKTITDKQVEDIVRLQAGAASEKETDHIKAAIAYDRIANFIREESGLWQTRYAENYQRIHEELMIDSQSKEK